MTFVFVREAFSIVHKCTKVETPDFFVMETPAFRMLPSSRKNHTIQKSHLIQRKGSVPVDYEKFLDRQFVMTDTKRIDRVRDLYTTFNPHVDLEALKTGGYLDALAEMMQPVGIDIHRI